MQNQQLKKTSLSLAVSDTSQLPKQKQKHNLSIHFSERKLLLAVVDLIVVNFVLLVDLIIRPDFNFELLTMWVRLPWFILLSGIWLVSGVIFNIYDLNSSAHLNSSLKRIFFAVIFTLLIYIAIPFITPSMPDRRIEIAMLLGITLVGVFIWRTFYAKILGHPNFQSRALIVGAGYSGQTLAEIFFNQAKLPGQNNGSGYNLLGFIDDDVTKQNWSVENYRIMGTRQDLVDLAKKLRINEIIVAVTRRETMHPELFEAILHCREMGITITTMSEVYERLMGRVPIAHSGKAIGIVMPLTYPPTYRLYLGSQRLLDILVSLVGCILLAFILPFVWIANRIYSPGPIFYKQERVGKGGESFAVIKLRSMRVDAEKTSGAVWAAEKDPRITKIGHFLRKTRLDEIPQFWNILVGDMSLIGPRPERPYFVKKLTEEIPFYRLRHAVKPGLTGWAQVKYRYTASVEDSLIKLQYDLYYIKHQNIFLDIRIVLKTIGVVIGLKGR